MDATVSTQEELEYKIYDAGKELDKNLDVHTNNEFKYFNEKELNDSVLTEGTLSIIHFNSTSLSCNHNKVLVYLIQNKKKIQ